MAEELGDQSWKTRNVVNDEHHRVEPHADEVEVEVEGSQSQHSLMASLNNLTLSQNPTVERPKQNGVASASASAVASASALGYGTNNRGIGMGMGMGMGRDMPLAYNPNFTSPYYYQGLLQPNVGMGGQYLPPVSAPPTVDFSEVLADICLNPYNYMKTWETCRCLSALLTRPPSLTYLDSFVRGLLQCEHSLVLGSCTNEGTYVIQTLIKVANKRSVIERLTLVLAHHAHFLMTNRCGMHVLEQCFVQLKDSLYQPLFVKINEDDAWRVLARDETGCRVLNVIIDHLVYDMKEIIISRVAKRVSELALDVYGTYIVQHVLDVPTKYTSEIVNNILPFVENLCMIKNGSHLLEKCLRTPYASRVVQVLVKSSKIMRHATNEFGNYVIQRALEYTQQNDLGLYRELSSKLCRQRDALMMNKFGRYVARCLPAAADHSRVGRTGGGRTYYQS